MRASSLHPLSFSSLCNLLFAYPFPSTNQIMVAYTLMEQVRQLLTSAHGDARKILLRELHEMIVGLETPEETATRM
jgi:hypothetical protein